MVSFFKKIKKCKNVRNYYLEKCTDGRQMGWDEIVIAETQQNVSFADTGVTDNQEFD